MFGALPRMATETATPPETLVKATETKVLPLTGISLIGTVVSPTNPKALVRLRKGVIRRVGVGDKVGSSKVIAIEAGAIYLARNGQNQKLTLPGD